GSALDLVVIEPVAIAQTSTALPRQRQFASRRAAFRRTPSKYRGKRRACRLATKCGCSGRARSSFCDLISAPRIREAHPLNPGASTKLYQPEYGFRLRSQLQTPDNCPATRIGARSRPNQAKAAAVDQPDSSPGSLARKGRPRSGTGSPSK